MAKRNDAATCPRISSPSSEGEAARPQLSCGLARGVRVSSLPLRRLRRGPGDAGAEHLAPLAVIVVERIVLRRAVVPDRQRALRPANAAGEVVVERVLVEMLQ